MIKKYILAFSALTISFGVNAQLWQGPQTNYNSVGAEIALQEKKDVASDAIIKEQKRAGIPAQLLKNNIPPIYTNEISNLNPYYQMLPRYNNTNEMNFVEQTNRGLTLPQLNLQQANTPSNQFIQGPTYPGAALPNALPKYGNTNTCVTWPCTNPYATPTNPLNLNILK